MTLSSESKYPSRRAYVLKLSSNAKPDTLCGRLENVITGRQHEFASEHELLDFLAADLQTSADHAAPK